MYAKEMLKQSLPLIIMCGLGAIVAGSTLGLMTDLFQEIPGLLVVIPAIIAMRGNISTALGSRLGSAYHLGAIDKDNLWNNDLKQNIMGSLTLSLTMSFLIGILAYLTSLFMGANPNALLIISIVLVAGILSALILTLMTIVIIFLVFKRGWDPDNVTGPALATFGDIITMACIFSSAIFIGGIFL